MRVYHILTRVLELVVRDLALLGVDGKDGGKSPRKQRETGARSGSGLSAMQQVVVVQTPL
jgi:hypothetical protein